MQNEDNAVIRYLMKEMDPSEEVLMERAMMEDDDLLIEVESMRQTLQRLDDLPEKSPPAELSETIVRQAAEQKQKTSVWPSIPSEAYKYAAVLLIGIGMGSGLLLYLDSSSPADTDMGNEASISTNIQPANTTKASDAEPWVDRDNVIYFQDMFNTESSTYDMIMQTSMNKLKPVNNQSLQPNPNSRNVQLTGSGN